MRLDTFIPFNAVNFVLMQDNAKHIAKIVTEYIVDVDINRIE